MAANTRHISLSIMAEDAETSAKGFELLTEMANLLSAEFPYVNVTSSSVNADSEGEERPEFYNDGTMFKVYQALRRAGLSEPQALNAINEMQNDGILFRERAASDELVG